MLLFSRAQNECLEKKPSRWSWKALLVNVKNALGSAYYAYRLLKELFTE